MAATSDTVARILDGALQALARRGRNKLSMSDVGEMSGISRGTLYRYFRNKKEILDAVGDHFIRGVQQHLRDAVEERPELDVRLRVVVESLLGYSMVRPETMQLIVLEPEFGLGFIRSVIPEFVDFIEELLTPALELTPVLRSGAMTSGEMAEIIVRVAVSTYFIPSDDPDEVPRTIAALPCVRIST